MVITRLFTRKGFIYTAKLMAIKKFFRAEGGGVTVILNPSNHQMAISTSCESVLSNLLCPQNVPGRAMCLTTRVLPPKLVVSLSRHHAFMIFSNWHPEHGNLPIHGVGHILVFRTRSTAAQHPGTTLFFG